MEQGCEEDEPGLGPADQQLLPAALKTRRPLDCLQLETLGSRLIEGQGLRKRDLI